MVLQGTTRTQQNQPRETLVPTGYVISFSLNEVDEQGVLRVVKEPAVHIPRKVKGQAAGLTATVHDDGAVIPRKMMWCLLALPTPQPQQCSSFGRRRVTLFWQLMALETSEVLL